MSAEVQLPTVVGMRLMDLRLDGGTQMRAKLCEETVERYRLVAKLLPAVTAFYDGTDYWLADGFQRCEAWRREEMDYVPADVRPGTLRDAILHAAGANSAHGLVRSREDARRAVERLLSDEEWRAKSDRWIADRCHVSPSTVGRLRLELGAVAGERQVTRGDSTYLMNVSGQGQTPSVQVGQIDPAAASSKGSDTVQAREPDNTKRTPVQREHKGAPLTQGMRDAMRALAAAGWSRAHIAERYRVSPQELEEALSVVAEACEECRSDGSACAVCWHDPEDSHCACDGCWRRRHPAPSSDVAKPEVAQATAPFERERTAPLSDAARGGMRLLFEGGWSPERLARRYRVPLAEVLDVVGTQLRLEHGIEDEDEDEPSDGRDITKDQWWTPPELAREMVRLAGVKPGDRVLEPSAGAGAIVEALLEAGATVDAHELDPRWAAYLRICGRHDVSEDPRWTSGQVAVHEGSYLDLTPVGYIHPPRAYTHAVINPPYREGLDGLFLGRVLDEADVVVALLRVNALCGQGRYESVWSRHGGRCTHVLPLVIRPDFTGSDRGSEGSGAKSDFVVLVFGAEDLGERAPVRHLAARYGGKA